jgi:hypothetical protein
MYEVPSTSVEWLPDEYRTEPEHKLRFLWRYRNWLEDKHVGFDLRAAARRPEKATLGNLWGPAPKCPVGRLILIDSPIANTFTTFASSTSIPYAFRHRYLSALDLHSAHGVTMESAASLAHIRDHRSMLQFRIRAMMICFWSNENRAEYD